MGCKFIDGALVGLEIDRCDASDSAWGEPVFRHRFGHIAQKLFGRGVTLAADADCKALGMIDQAAFGSGHCEFSDANAQFRLGRLWQGR